MKNEGKFCGICNDPLNITCLERNKFLRYEYRHYIINDWRIKWSEFLKNVDLITCFSSSSKNYIQKVYPAIPIDKISVKPHNVSYIREAIIDKHDDYNIGVLGNITEFKGASIVKKYQK
jgi:hypothetical protein